MSTLDINQVNGMITESTEDGYYYPVQMDLCQDRKIRKSRSEGGVRGVDHHNCPNKLDNIYGIYQALGGQTVIGESLVVQIWSPFRKWPTYTSMEDGLHS